jgi:Xaa-Pro aminopeptidase
MPLDVQAIQAALRADGLDGWLLYDFQGVNPIARALAGLGGSRKMTTRRWYYLIPASGTPRKLVHRIEAHTLDAVPGDATPYAGHESLRDGLARLLDGCRRVAMEYSPRCAIPYLSRVDGGTLEQVRACGVDVLSSGDLVQQFMARWSDEAVATHREAAAALYRIKDRTFEALRHASTGGALTEYALQQQMVEWFADEGLVSDAAPVVAAMENAGDPHYQPSDTRSRAIRPNELVLIDLWGKIETPGAVYADISWVGFTGADVPADMTRAFDAVVRARDAAADLVQARVRSGEPVRGFEVDRAARAVLVEAGYAEAILHRTGHSLGETVHGQGVHMDDYETHDERRLLPGTGFTLEPGVYFKSFGMRSEINVLVGDGDIEVTGARQMEIIRLTA